MRLRYCQTSCVSRRLFDDQQQVMRVHIFVCRHGNSLHSSGNGGVDGSLHLHRFHDQQFFALSDGLARAHV